MRPQLDELMRRFAAPLRNLRQSRIEVEKYAPRDHGPLLSEIESSNGEEVDRYWVDPPFAYVSIRYHDIANEHRYHSVAPELTDREADLLADLRADLRQTLLQRGEPDEKSPDAVMETELTALLERYGRSVDTASYYRILYYLYRHFRGYRQLDPVLKDPYVEDISCDGYERPLFVYHEQYTDLRTNIAFTADELDDFVVRLAQRAGQTISIADPIAHAMLPDGSRSELALGEAITPHGSAFTIRRYSAEPMTPVSLLHHGTFSIEQLAYLWLAIENNRSLIFAGGTASGKTTSLNAVSMFIPPRSKVLSIEDTPEIRLHHENWLPAVTRERVDNASGIEMYDLLRSALRHRPEYIIVGEVRGAEASTLFQAMNTGHTTFSTLHADTIQTVINRLENDPINVPRAMIQSLDILSVQAIHHRGGDRVRRARELTEIVGIDQRTGDLDYASVFDWQPTTDRFRGNLEQSQVLDEIADEHGWTMDELRGELRNRQRVLRFAQELDVTDYQNFTAMVTEYYADPDAVLARVDGRMDETTSRAT